MEDKTSTLHYKVLSDLSLPSINLFTNNHQQLAGPHKKVQPHAMIDHG